MALEAEVLELLKANTALHRERGRLQLQRTLQGTLDSAAYAVEDSSYILIHICD